MNPITPGNTRYNNNITPRPPKLSDFSAPISLTGSAGRPFGPSESHKQTPQHKYVKISAKPITHHPPLEDKEQAKVRYTLWPGWSMGQWVAFLGRFGPFSGFAYLYLLGLLRYRPLIRFMMFDGSPKSFHSHRNWKKPHHSGTPQPSSFYWLPSRLPRSWGRLLPSLTQKWTPNSLSEKHNPVILEHPSLNPFSLHLAFHGRKEVVIFRDDLEKMQLQVGTSTCTPVNVQIIYCKAFKT